MSSHRRNSSLEETLSPYSVAEDYYGPKTDIAIARPDSRIGRTRTLSIGIKNSDLKQLMLDSKQVKFQRRGSEDEIGARLSGSGDDQKILITNVDETLKNILESEDTDSNNQITIEDTGPKSIRLGTLKSNGFKRIEIRGNYMISNLLQELTIAKSFGRHQIILDEARLNENPVNRLTRLIKEQFWNSLTRRIDSKSIKVFAKDDKIKSNPRIYVPIDCPDQYQFYKKVSDLNPELDLDVVYLPELSKITPEYIKSINDKPGLLALAMQKTKDEDGEDSLASYPYVVPGGRFNEMYGWDSYMITLGLNLSNRFDLSRGLIEHFIFEINHYGKVLNANRSYYLGRSQPPFLTDMLLKNYDHIIKVDPDDAMDLLKRGVNAAIKEYKTLWCSAPRLDVETGLSCYHPMGIGIPPETESTHFDPILAPYALKYDLTIKEFIAKYNDGIIKEPILDEYFENDRAVRESGHDTSYRLDGVCKDLATVDLNSLLFKYETDLAFIIKTYFNDKFVVEGGDGTVETSQDWIAKSVKRKEAMNKYLWNEDKRMYFDYNVKLKKQSTYESATTFWPLWCKQSDMNQVEGLISNLHKFEEFGGISSGTKESRGEITLERPNRQWDYPYGWAPQQILVWQGFENYGFRNISSRLCYRWLYLITKSFVDYNGIVVEKYDVTRSLDPHRVDAEYGNQGADFKGVATEGFGWVNASYLIGLEYLSTHAIRALGACIPPDLFFARLKDSELQDYAISAAK